MSCTCVWLYLPCIVRQHPPGEKWHQEAVMASPLVEYCEQANPGVLSEIRRVGGTTGNARRVQASFLADLEKKALIWVAQRTPSWINSDHLTALGLLGQLSAGSFYAFSRWNK